MILVDYRQGSKELVDPLCDLGLPAVITTLGEADIAFQGRGEGGAPTDIGIEYKQLGECVQAMRTGRLQEQAERMQQTYEYRWLLIEGELMYDRKGRLLRRTGRKEFAVMPGGMGVVEFLKRIFVLHLRRGLSPLFAKDQRTSLKMLETLYRVWTDQDLDDHASHIAIFQPPSIVPLTGFRKNAMTLPGIGFKASLAAERQFKTLGRAYNAKINVAEWAEVQTIDKQGKLRRIGTKAAEDIARYFS